MFVAILCVLYSRTPLGGVTDCTYYCCCSIGPALICAAQRVAIGRPSAAILRLCFSACALPMLLEHKSRHGALSRYVLTFAVLAWLRRAGIERVPGVLRFATLYYCWSAQLKALLLGASKKATNMLTGQRLKVVTSAA